MDKVTQLNAATAEESAPDPEELNAQAEEKKRFVADLAAVQIPQSSVTTESMIVSPES